MLLTLAFAAASFSRRSPDFHSSFRLGSCFLPKSGLIELRHLLRSRNSVDCQTRPQTAGRTPLPCELLQVGVEVVLIEERPVVIVKRLKKIGMLFVFDECCR